MSVLAFVTAMHLCQLFPGWFSGKEEVSIIWLLNGYKGVGMLHKLFILKWPRGVALKLSGNIQ